MAIGINQEQRQKISRIVAILLFGGYALIASRLLHVQVTAADSYASQQDSMISRQRHKIGNSQFERGLRGRILDASGTELALGFDTHRLIVDPGMPRRKNTMSLRNRLEIAYRALGSVGVHVDRKDFFATGMQKTYDWVAEDGRLNTTRVRRRVLVSGLLPYQREYLRQLFKRQTNRHALSDFSFEAESEREYPQGALVAEVVGFVARSDQDLENKARGRAGIEYTLDRVLSGKNGEFVCEKDGAGNEFDQDGRWIKRPEDGQDVGLSLDLGIQTIADEAIRATFAEFDCKAVTAIVMETQTGRILALRSYPSFAVEDVYQERVEIKDTICRPVTNTYPPGSTMKPFIVAFALERGLVNWDDTFDVSKAYQIFRHGNRKRRVRDSHPNGVLDLVGVLRKSSNIAMAVIGFERLGLDGMHDALDAYEFGQKSRVLLPHEPRPIYQSREKSNPVYFPTSVSYGQEISLTPLQMTSKFSIFGTSGIYHEPTIVDWVGKGEDRDVNHRGKRRLISAQIADEMKAALMQVVEDGTARGLRDLPWTVAAKTGTAEIFEKSGAKSGYSSAMIALAPASDPQITVWVGVHDLNGPTIYGSKVAGPAVKEIIEKTLKKLGVPGDRTTEDD